MASSRGPAESSGGTSRFPRAPSTGPLRGQAATRPADRAAATAEALALIELRPVETDAELDAYVEIWNRTTPDDLTTPELQRERWARDPGRLYLLAWADGRADPVATGFAGKTDSPGRGGVAPRVLPEARRQGIGTAILRRLCDHLLDERYTTASAILDEADTGARAFARRYGFEEVDRQVEQMRTLGDETPPEVPEGVRFVTVAERPELLRDAYELAVDAYADMATWVPVTISLDEWLREEATIPEGSFVALAGDTIVGYSGLCRHVGDAALAEDGLTAVRRDWRRRGLATALKRAELAWAAANGIREVVTWTQRANEGMRAVNERLGYRYGKVEVTVARALPLVP